MRPLSCRALAFAAVLLATLARADDPPRIVRLRVPSDRVKTLFPAGTELRVMPRDEFARGIATGFGLDPAGIIGEPSSRLGLQTPRPLQGGMRTERIETLLPGLIRRLVPALADFRSRLDADEGWLDPRPT